MGNICGSPKDKGVNKDTLYKSKLPKNLKPYADLDIIRDE